MKARILKGEEAKDGPLMPWFRGFEGNVKRSSRGVFRFEGNVSHNRLKVMIKELPPRVWTQQYKETLSSMVRGVRSLLFQLLRALTRIAWESHPVSLKPLEFYIIRKNTTRKCYEKLNSRFALEHRYRDIVLQTA